MSSSSVLLARLMAVSVPLACSSGSASDGTAVDGREPAAVGGAASAPAHPVGAGGRGLVADGGGGMDPSSGGDSAASGGATSGGGTSVGGAVAVAGASQGPMAEPSDDRLFVPEGLPVTNLSGEGKAVNVIASTLLAGVDGPELFAAVRNDGEMTACDAAISFELFDPSGQSVGAWIGALFSESLYRRSDGSGGLIACIDPGGLGMVALTDLPENIALDELGAAVYQLTYFDRDILPFELARVGALTVSGVETVSRDAMKAFTGTFENGLEVAVSNATVTIFPLNEVGRPLGVATSSSTAEVPSGGSWTFETTRVDDPGANHIAYPSATISL